MREWNRTIAGEFSSFSWRVHTKVGRGYKAKNDRTSSGGDQNSPVSFIDF